MDPETLRKHYAEIHSPDALIIGAVAFIKKPLIVKDLSPLIRQALDQREARRKLSVKHPESRNADVVVGW